MYGDVFCCNKCKEEFDEFFIASLDLNYIARLYRKRQTTREKILERVAKNLDVNFEYLKEHVFYILWENGWVETKTIEDRRLLESISKMKDYKKKSGLILEYNKKKRV
jgi:hypothetical protein